MGPNQGTLSRPPGRRTRRQIARAIAGSDSGGGAGLQADLKTFAALGVHGTSVVTCLTAQNPRTVLSVAASSAECVRSQLEAVFSEIPPRAAKTGMLYESGVVQAVINWFREHRGIPLVVDPVAIATSGARLLRAPAFRLLRDDLLPLASLVTPNIPEAEKLLGCSITGPEDLREAARALHTQHGCAVLVKGGHLQGTGQAIDILFDGKDEWLFSARRVRAVRTHGTGCTYAAAIVAFLARGETMVEAVFQAKSYVTQAIAQSVRIGRHEALNWNP